MNPPTGPHGTGGGMNSILLWPATILHAVIGAMMLWVILTTQERSNELPDRNFSLDGKVLIVTPTGKFF
jgi:hypothetical protein